MSTDPQRLYDVKVFCTEGRIHHFQASADQLSTHIGPSATKGLYISDGTKGVFIPPQVILYIEFKEVK